MRQFGSTAWDPDSGRRATRDQPLTVARLPLWHDSRITVYSPSEGRRRLVRECLIQAVGEVDGSLAELDGAPPKMVRALGSHKYHGAKPHLCN
jgi:hypothetical protein